MGDMEEISTSQRDVVIGQLHAQTALQPENTPDNAFGLSVESKPVPFFQGSKKETSPFAEWFIVASQKEFVKYILNLVFKHSLFSSCIGSCVYSHYIRTAKFAL
jgi:hypothetical protein